MSNTEQHTGTVKHFDNSKGFGFIKQDLNKEDIFFHISGTTEDVEKGDRVAYDITDGKRGDNAINIIKID